MLYFCGLCSEPQAQIQFLNNILTLFVNTHKELVSPAKQNNSEKV
jgi:hypothetical protein